MHARASHGQSSEGTLPSESCSVRWQHDVYATMARLRTTAGWHAAIAEQACQCRPKSSDDDGRMSEWLHSACAQARVSARSMSTSCMTK